MNIRLPNGKVLQGIPEGTTKTQVLSFLKRKDFDSYKALLGTMRGTDTARPEPVLGSEGLGAAMVAAGESTDRLLTGARNLLPGDDPERSLLGDNTSAERKQIMAPLESEFPVSTALGSTLPAFAIPMGGAARAAGGLLGKAGLHGAGRAIAASPIADAMLTGGLLGGLDEEGSAAVGAAGGFAGGLIGKGAAGLMRPVANRLTSSGSRVRDLAAKTGYQVSPADATASPGLRRLEASLRSSPLSSGAFRAGDEANQATINKLAAESIGEVSDVVTDEVLDKAARRIGSEFERIANKAGDVPVDDALISKVFSIIDDHLEPLPEADKLLGLFNAGKLSGRDMLAQSSKLGNKGRRVIKNDPDRAFAIFELKDALDDALMRSVKGSERKALATARRKWKSLVRLLEPGVIASPTKGDVSAATLGNVLRRKDKIGFMRGRGRGPLEDAARIGKAFPGFPDSGTASRMGVPMALGGAGTGIAGYQLAEGDPGEAALYGLLPLLAGAGAGRTYNNPLMRRYIEKGIPLLGKDSVRKPMGGLLGRAGASAGLLAAP